MAALHALTVHFPIGILNIAFLFILLRALSGGSLAVTLAKSIPWLILLGLIGGAAGYLVGLLVWPFSALVTTPLGRNHLLAASWTLAFWTVLLVLFWTLGERLWAGANRWVTLALSVVGVGLLTITGTLGGSLAGSPSAVSRLVRAVIWEPYTTLYVPDVTLWLLLGASLLLLALAIASRRLPD